MEPLGFTREVIEGLLARVAAAEDVVRAQEEAKGVARNAASEAKEAGKRFRQWYYPWKKQIGLGLKLQPRLLERVTSAEQGR